MHKINSLNHSLLAYTQEFLRWLFSQSQQFLTDIFKNNLFFIKSSFGVCSCFSLFNLQGTPLPLEPPALRDSLHMIPRLPLCVKRFFEFFCIYFFDTGYWEIIGAILQDMLSELSACAFPSLQLYYRQERRVKNVRPHHFASYRLADVSGHDRCVYIKEVGHSPTSFMPFRIPSQRLAEAPGYAGAAGRPSHTDRT